MGKAGFGEEIKGAISKVGLILTVAFAAAFLGHPSALMGQSSDSRANASLPVDSMLQPVHRTYGVGQAVELRLTVRNTSAESWDRVASTWRELLSLKVMRELSPSESDGNQESSSSSSEASTPHPTQNIEVKPYPVWDLSLTPETAPRIRLRPGENQEIIFLLSKDFHLSKPGRYTVNATLFAPAPASGDIAAEAARSTTLTCGIVISRTQNADIDADLNLARMVLENSAKPNSSTDLSYVRKPANSEADRKATAARDLIVTSFHPAARDIQMRFIRDTSIRYFNHYEIAFVVREVLMNSGPEDQRALAEAIISRNPNPGKAPAETASVADEYRDAYLACLRHLGIDKLRRDTTVILRPWYHAQLKAGNLHPSIRIADWENEKGVAQDAKASEGKKAGGGEMDPAPQP